MVNNVMLVGRMAGEIQEVELNNEKKGCILTLAVPRSFKNADGIYETDFFKVILWGSIADNTQEYCQKGDLVGIRGRLESHNDKVEIVADKVTFLSACKKDGE